MSGITICLEPDMQRDMVLGQYCVYLSVPGDQGEIRGRWQDLEY